MAVAAATTALWTDRRRRALELRDRYGFARELLDFYAALLGVQEKAYIDVRSSPPPAGERDAYAAEVVMPSVVDVGVAAGPERLRTELSSRFGSFDGIKIVGDWLAGDEQNAVDRFLARASLQPVLEALAQESEAIRDGTRNARQCPICGGPPQLGFSVRAADDLATGGRFLVCARCAHAWGYARMTCPGCGEDASSRLNFFTELGTTSGELGTVVRGLPSGPRAPSDPAVFPHMRIEACDTCRQYLLSVDLAADPAAVPMVDEIAAIPLDLFARERRYSKIITNLMGF
jgi:hypothetical protein